MITLVILGHLCEAEKDLEILLLRQQISILLRNRVQPVNATRVEKLKLTAFAARLKEITNRSSTQLGEIMRLFQPEAVLGWHRELVRRQ